MVTGAGYGDKKAGNGAGGLPFGPLAPILAGLGTAPSTDYRSWKDLARREVEREMLYGDAQPTTGEFDIEDLDGLDKGKLRLGLFIAAPGSRGALDPVRPWVAEG